MNKTCAITMPNFLIIGAAKAGTTSFYHYLKQHPQIYMSPIKETNYFALAGEDLDFRGPGDGDFIGRFSLLSKEAYREQFMGVRGERAVGEASPLYLYDAQAPCRIRHHLPDVKLVAILRHPVDRAYSAFLHLVRDGREPSFAFAQALQHEDLRIRDRWEHIWHYKQMGFYFNQLRRYYDVFARSQIQIHLYDTLQCHPHKVISEVFRFLEVEEGFVPDVTLKHNVASGELPPLLPEVRRQLAHLYKEDLSRLQDLIEMDLSGWFGSGSA